MKYLSSIIISIFSIILVSGLAYSEERRTSKPYKETAFVMEIDLPNKTFIICEEEMRLKIVPPFNKIKSEDTLFVSKTGQNMPLSQLQDGDYVLAEGIRHAKTNKVIIDKITLLKPRTTNALKKNQDIPLKKVNGVWRN